MSRELDDHVQTPLGSASEAARDDDQGGEAAPPPPEVGRWLLGGLAAYVVLVWGLRARLGFPLLDALYLAVLVELLPVLAVAQVPLVARGPVERIPAYLASAVTTGVLGFGGILLGVRRFGLQTFGLAPLEPGLWLAWSLGLTLAGLTLLWAVLLIRRSLGVSETWLLRELLPRARKERLLFALLSLAAGVGEEAAFRGYALQALAPHVGGLWGSAAFTSLVFGILHAYQGPLGMARTFLLGFLLATSVVLSGSLWPAILAHFALDLVAGLIIGESLTR